MAKVEIDGFELTYEKHGHGKDTIITSCLPNNATEPLELISLLAKHYIVYDITLRTSGFPTTTQDEVGNPILTTWAEDIYRFSCELCIEKFVYMGISHAGLVGWNLAYIHPEVLKGFVSIVGTPQDRGFMNTDAVRYVELNWLSPEAPREYWNKVFVPTTNKVRIARRERIIREEMTEPKKFGSKAGPGPGLSWPECKTNKEMITSRLSKIKVPTLIISGIQDHFMIPEHPFMAAKAVPGAKSVFFQDESHWIYGESPERVFDEIDLFVNELNRKG